MRIVDTHPDAEGTGAALRPLVRSDENDTAFERWAGMEIEDALSARHEADREWRDALRRYEAVPRLRQRDTPVENAPNIEVALGAMAADSIYAQYIETIFGVAPIVTARPVGNDKPAQQAAAALQRRIDHGVASEWNFRPAIETMALDTVQLGTGCFYIPFTESTRQTDIVKVKERGARIEAWPLEDVLVPGGARTDVQTVRWIGLRSWYSPGELEVVARRSGWDTSGWMKTAGQDWIRSQRESLGRTRTTKATTALYEVIHLFAHFDYDGDGIDEDLYAVFDRSSGHLGFLTYNPYDTRPIEAARYQLRAHLFYGMGVLEMARPGQEVVSELMNAALLNTALRNIPVIAVRQGQVDDGQKMWAGKLIPCMDPTGDFVVKQLAETAPETGGYIQMNMGLVERRVGVNDMSLPRPSAIMGSRTPGITAMSMLQQVNRRFTPAFDQMRIAASAAVSQCLYREQERLLAGDPDLEDYLRRILGPADGQTVIDLLRDPNFDESVTIELTASSASVNREADRQSAILLVNVLGQYYTKAMELITMAANPQIPPPVRDVAKKIADAASTIIERTIRTFDIARDPSTFIIDMNAEIDQLGNQLDPAALGQLAQMIGLMGGQPPGGGGPPGLPPPAMPEAA